jgi:hypothetical protein
MARSLSQGSAWVLAVVLSMMIFGVLLAIVANTPGAHQSRRLLESEAVAPALSPTPEAEPVAGDQVPNSGDAQTIRADDPAFQTPQKSSSANHDDSD